MRAAVLIVIALSALSACGAPPRRTHAATPVPTPPPPAPAPNPFDADSASFLINGGRFPAGETAIVKVCVTPQGTIASADVVGSSGDKRFDDFALVWARQVRLKSLPPGAQVDSVCGAVRVEIKAAPVPEGLPGRQNALS